jgi:hypothetical protein
MWYLGTPTATPPPASIPDGAYSTNLATAPDHYGPWTQHATPVPFSPQPGGWCAATASPGPVIRWQGRWWMYFSGSGPAGRSIGLAVTDDLRGTWALHPDPLLPLAHQLENAAIFCDTGTGRWWLFANHITHTPAGSAYTDAVVGYWSADPLAWSADRRTVVLDRSTCRWTRAVGMPSVTPLSSGRLAMFYDGNAAGSIGHLRRDIGLALLPLPLRLA